MAISNGHTLYLHGQLKLTNMPQPVSACSTDSELSNQRELPPMLQQEAWLFQYDWILETF